MSGDRSPLTFQQTDRQPATQGLSEPLNLTARCKSAKLELCLSVSPQRVLSQSRSVLGACGPRSHIIDESINILGVVQGPHRDQRMLRRALSKSRSRRDVIGQTKWMQMQVQTGRDEQIIDNNDK